MSEVYLECNHCGGPAIYGDKDGLFTDGTGDRCITCKMPGSVCCDSETEAAWNTNDNEGDRCIETDCPSCHPTITIPRDLHELHKEAAEKWAKEQVDPGNGWSYNNEHCCWTCMDCYEPLEHWDKSPTVHAADCKAARILGLKREGAE